MRNSKLFLALLMLLSVGVTQVWATIQGFPVNFDKTNYTGVTVITGSPATWTSNAALSTATNGVYFGNQNSGKYHLFTIPVKDFAANDSITVTLGNVKVSNSSYKMTFKMQYSTNGSSYTDFGSSWTESETATNIQRGVRIPTAVADGNIYIKILSTSGGGTKGGNHYIKTADITYTAAPVASSLSIKTNPTKVNYKVGETLNLTGLVLNADENDVTSGYTASPANGAALNSVGAQTVTISYGGQTTDLTIHVGALESIAVATAPTKTTYNQGQTFDPTGMVVEATFSDGETTPTEWDVEVNDYTYSPTTALAPANTSITISYTWNEVEKTTTQAITVNAATAYTVTFDAGTGSCGTASLTEPEGLAGVTLPTATIGVSGWSFAGWAAASATNTDVAPTLYAASSTYHPTEDCTLYAVYSFSEKSTTIYKRATSVSDITSASSVVVVSNNLNKVLNTTFGGSVTPPTETSSKITAPENAVFTLTGNNSDGYTLTNGTTTIGATSTDNSTLVSNTTTNKLWVVKAHGTTNTFYFENKAKSDLCLEHYNSSGYKWMVYAPATPSSNTAMAMKVYVPADITVYNSNPAAIINPTVAFTTAGDKSLYVQDEASYTNAANVTGIAKTPVYSSSDETVATITSAGVVTALKAGTAIITAKVEKEVGVNNEASASYTVTVKDAKTIAGLKAITSTSTVKTFTADLTDAVVTYVNGNHAYIQDASGAVYASCGSSLTAGKKINGAVSGSIKAANQIDEITSIDLSGATVTDGDIPAAQVKTAAQLIANKTDLEGKLVSIASATVTVSMTSGNASGGKISDDAGTSVINLYAPNSNIEALAAAEGTFNGYITLYGGSTIRFNIYEQSQITLTKNAPTDQPLAFANDAIELDHPSAEFEAFTGQAVTGAKTTPVYSIESDVNGVVTSINSETGAVVLSGNAGTATIKAAAPKDDDGVDEYDFPTPWKATSKTYTITVTSVYTITWNVNGAETTQTGPEGTTLTPPAITAITGKVSRGWTDAAIDGKTDVKPTIVELTTMPAKDTTLYALYATQNSESQELEFSYTIVPGDFSSSSYESTNEKTKTATCTSDNSKTVSVKFTANKIMNQSSKIQGQASNGVIYNAARWGKVVKSVTINDNNGNFSYKIGSSAQPSTSATGAFFKISTASTFATASSIAIVFDSTVTVTTYDAYITNAYAVTFDVPSDGTLAVKNAGVAITSGDKFPKGTILTVEATPTTAGYKLITLTANGTDIKEAKSFTIGTANVVVVATFEDATALDNLESEVKAVKVLIDGQIFILRDGKTYTVTGQLVK